MADKRYANLPRGEKATSSTTLGSGLAAITSTVASAPLVAFGTKGLETSIGAGRGSLLQTVFQYLFYLSALAFFLFLLLTFLHFTVTPIFSFGEDDSQGILSMPTTTGKQTSFTKSPCVPDISANFLNLLPYGWTLGFDINILGEFNTTTVPRVILYRAEEPITLDSSISDSKTIQTDVLKNSNLIVYIDALKNDLRALVTHLDSTHTDVLLVDNVSLRTPVRFNLVFTDTYMEVYKGGQLERSVPFAKKPLNTPATAYWFGPPTLVNGAIKVGNLAYWDMVLTSKSVRVYGTSTIDTTPFGSVRAA